MPSSILIRDSFDDTGKVSFSTRYKSPDIITHSQVNDPTAFFYLKLLFGSEYSD